MMKLHVVGFVLVVGLVVAGADYSRQAKKAGLSIGQLGVGGYIDTFSDRIDATKEAAALRKEASALRERQKQLAKTHLPEAPEGWIRREWSEGDNSRIMPFLGDNASNSAMGDLLAMDVAPNERRLQRGVWVYEHGDEIIVLSANYRKPGSARSGFSAVTVKLVTANERMLSGIKGYALVQGVAFGENILKIEGSDPDRFRSFSAKIGEDITLGIRASASDEAILLLLKFIDYDALNAMLDQPVQEIGTNAPAVDPASEIEIIEQILGGQFDGVQHEEQKPSADTVAPETEPESNEVGVGFSPVRQMPGQECERNNNGRQVCRSDTD